MKLINCAFLVIYSIYKCNKTVATYTTQSFTRCGTLIYLAALVLIITQVGKLTINIILVCALSYSFYSFFQRSLSNIHDPVFHGSPSCILVTPNPAVILIFSIKFIIGHFLRYPSTSYIHIEIHGF